MATEPHGARILIVDDDPGILRAVSRILGRRHQVVCGGIGRGGARGGQDVQARPGHRRHPAAGDERLRGYPRLKQLQPDVDAILMTGNAEEPDETLIRAIDEGAFYFIQKPFDRRVLLTLVNRCLELRELREQREQFLRRVERELEEARQFQLSLLPPSRMELPGLTIAARYLACNELAGDIYDYVEAGDGAVAVLIADVVGHGTSAAMMTGVVKAAFRASHVDGFEPMAVVDRVKEGIRDFDPSRFVTLVLCAGSIPGAASCGTSTPAIPSRSSASGAARPVLLDSTGPILSSALFDIPCEQATCALGPGDSLLLYTDGVTEAHGPGGMFGQDRLVSAILRGHRGSDLLDGLLSEVVAFSNSPNNQDDITLLTLELTAANGQ